MKQPADPSKGTRHESTRKRGMGGRGTGASAMAKGKRPSPGFQHAESPDERRERLRRISGR